jgi:predicted P-loop ATPase
MLRAMIDAATPYHPIQEYLSGLPAWDRKERLEAMLIELMGAEDTELNRAYSRRWMVSAVARAFEPGCQADHMLILQGKQGVGKSSFLRDLCPKREWFGSGAFDPSRDGRMRISSLWIFEFAELAALASRDIESVKEFITNQVDTYRAPYARSTQEHPRMGVLAGTTNQERFLRDEENRRFWVVPVSKQCAPGTAAAIRDLLWAEALHRYRAGEQWWLSPELEASSETAKRRDHMHVDEWAIIHADEITRQYRRMLSQGEPGITTKEVIIICTRSESHGFDGSKVKRGDEVRAGSALRSLGFVPQRLRRRGERARFYRLAEDFESDQ